MAIIIEYGVDFYMPRCLSLIVKSIKVIFYCPPAKIISRAFSFNLKYFKPAIFSHLEMLQNTFYLACTYLYKILVDSVIRFNKISDNKLKNPRTFEYYYFNMMKNISFTFIKLFHN